MWIYCNIFIITLLYCVQGDLLEPGNEINISFNDFNPLLRNGQLNFVHYQLNPLGKNYINITNIPLQISFIIIQVHTQETNIKLLLNDTNTSEINGTNIGLYINSIDITHTIISVENYNNKSVLALIAAIGYTSQAPVPGGCNMELNVSIAPYQNLTMNDAMIKVNISPASQPIQYSKQSLCNDNFTIVYDSYRLYISKGDYTIQKYLAALEKMLTVDEIIKNGEKISSSIPSKSLSKIYSSYPGTGSVYVTIATYNNYSSAYVPSFSYGCKPISNLDTCYLLKTSLSKSICALIFFIGLSLTFFGHRCLAFQVMLSSSISGGIIGNIILNSFQMQDTTLEFGLSILIGLIVGVIVTWSWCMEKFIPAILQASFSLGALIASITYLGIPDDDSLYKSNGTFWSIYVGICLMVAFILCVCAMNSLMICYSILGSYAIILPIDYWLGSNLKYIIINTIRRIVIPEFTNAIINPPFQSTDIWLSIIWIILALFGIYVQARGLNGRLPFPCSGKYTTIVSGNNYPTLSAERNGRRVLILGKQHEVYQDKW